MKHTIQLIDFLCHTYRKPAHAIKGDAIYNYVLYAYYKINDRYVIVNTTFDVETLDQALEAVSHYHYTKKPTATQMKLLLNEQKELIQDIVSNTQSPHYYKFIDIKELQQEEDIIVLGFQYRYDPMNLTYLKQKQAFTRELSDRVYQFVIKWYKKNADIVSYVDFKESTELKMWGISDNQNIYLIFKKI